MLLLWACGILGGMQFAKISVAFQPLQVLYGVGPAPMGWVLSAVGLVGLALGVTMGLFATAIGVRRLLLGGLALGATLSAAQSLLPPFPLLLVSRMLEGASHLAIVVAAPTLIGASCAPQHRAIAMGLWSTFVGVAFALMAAVGSGVIARSGLDGLLQLHALGMAGMLVWLLAATRRDPHPEPAPWPPLRTLLRQHAAVYTDFHTVLPGLTFFCYTAVAVALLTFVPPWTGADRAWLAVVLPLMVIAGNFGAGWLVQHWLAPLQLARVAFSAVALAALWLGWSHAAGQRLGAPALALLFTSGLAGGSAFALIPYLCHDSRTQARANGAVAQMGNLGSSCGPPLLAACSAQWGIGGLVGQAVLASVLGFALASWARRHLARR